jgi:hypothetical protein
MHLLQATSAVCCAHTQAAVTVNMQSDECHPLAVYTCSSREHSMTACLVMQVLCQPTGWLNLHRYLGCTGLMQGAKCAQRRLR